MCASLVLNELNIFPLTFLWLSLISWHYRFPLLSVEMADGSSRRFAARCVIIFAGVLLGNLCTPHTWLLYQPTLPPITSMIHSCALVCCSLNANENCRMYAQMNIFCEKIPNIILYAIFLEIKCHLLFYSILSDIIVADLVQLRSTNICMTVFTQTQL